MGAFDAQINQVRASTPEIIAELDKIVLTDLTKLKNVEDIPLRDVDEKHHIKIWAMLKKHEAMWSSHLGKIYTKE